MFITGKQTKAGSLKEEGIWKENLNEEGTEAANAEEKGKVHLSCKRIGKKEFRNVSIK